MLQILKKILKKPKNFLLKENTVLLIRLLKPLLDKYPENTQSSHAYLTRMLNIIILFAGLKLNQEIAEDAAKRFIDAANNEPRQQMMSFHLAKYYFTKNDFAVQLFIMKEQDMII